MTIEYLNPAPGDTWKINDQVITGAHINSADTPHRQINALHQMLLGYNLDSTPGQTAGIIAHNHRGNTPGNSGVVLAKSDALGFCGANECGRLALDGQVLRNWHEMAPDATATKNYLCLAIPSGVHSAYVYVTVYCTFAAGIEDNVNLQLGLSISHSSETLVGGGGQPIPSDTFTPAVAGAAGRLVRFGPIGTPQNANDGSPVGLLYGSMKAMQLDGDQDNGITVFYKHPTVFSAAEGYSAP